MDILIKSFMRHDILLFSLSTLRRHFNGRIVVVDDSWEVNDIVKKKIKDLNVEFHQVEPNIGLSAGRNLLLEKVTSDWFLMMDNDFILENPHGIEIMLNLAIKTNSDIVGGKLWDYGVKEPRNFCGFFDKDNKNEIMLNFYNISEIPKKKIDNFTYYECRFCQNFFIGNTKSFLTSKVKWDNNFKLMEHEDFFIRLPAYFKIIETPDVHVKHYPALESDDLIPEYKGFKGVVYDKKYAEYRYNKTHKEKVKKQYGLSGDFFKYNRDVYFDWTKEDFPVVKNVKLI